MIATADEDAIRHELRSLAERYARAVDRRDDIDGFVDLFHPDAVIALHAPSDTETPSEIRGAERLARIPTAGRTVNASTDRASTVVGNAFGWQVGWQTLAAEAPHDG